MFIAIIGKISGCSPHLKTKLRTVIELNKFVEKIKKNENLDSIEEIDNINGSLSIKIDLDETVEYNYDLLFVFRQYLFICNV